MFSVILKTFVKRLSMFLVILQSLRLTDSMVQCWNRKGIRFGDRRVCVYSWVLFTSDSVNLSKFLLTSKVLSPHLKHGILIQFL